MRIRRRPQAQAPIPSPYPPQLQQASSDPSTAPSQLPPPNQHHCLPRYEEEVEENNRELHLYSAKVDLGDEPSPAARRPLPWSHPQGNNVVGRSSDGRGGGGAQRRQGEVADGPGSLQNGHHDEREWRVTDAAAGEHLVNGSVVLAMPLAASTVPQNVKEGTTVKSDGPKRRRGPAVLLEGSRCSRVNGRGWRCSQPTLVGYSLCEHHLGKGRQSRSGRTTAGVPKLGRTEPASSRKKNAAALAVVPDAAETAAHLING